MPELWALFGRGLALPTERCLSDAARDRADAELLESGEHGRLLATYFEEARGRCRATIRTEPDADEAQRVFERVLRGATQRVQSGSMSPGIFLLQSDEDLLRMEEEPYEAEEVLQQLLAKYPDLLAADEETSRQWVLVRREVGLPSQLGGAARWSVDHLFLDQEGVPTLVETKRSENSQIRREIVGQMLDYAANAVVYWPIERLRATFEARCQGEGKDAERLIGELRPDGTVDEFWTDVETNLQAGRVRLVFVADEIPNELRRIIEFLNVQMSPAEAFGVEVKRYTGQGQRTLVAQLVGRTAEAEQRKGRGGSERSVATAGAAEFRAWIAKAPPERKPQLTRLAAWAESLERQGLARLFTGHTKTEGKNLLPKLPHEDVGLVTIWRDGSMWIWKSVLQRAAPAHLAQIESLSAPIPLGKTVFDPSDELLEALTAAYRAAAEPVSA